MRLLTAVSQVRVLFGAPKNKALLSEVLCFLCLCPQDTTSFDRLRSTSFFAKQKHHSALADTKRGCLTANSIVISTNVWYNYF